MMELCFVDDDISRPTYDVIDGMQKYAERQNINLKCELLLLAENMSGQDEDTFKYFANKYKDNNIPLKKCSSEEELKKELSDRLSKNIKFMVDLCLVKDEIDHIENNQNYKCCSMEVLDLLCKEKFYIYSSYTEDIYKISWCKRFRELYGQDEPDIIERELFMPTRFSEKYAGIIIS